MKISLILILLFIGVTSYGASNWSQLYKIVQSDIKTIEKLKAKDMGLKQRLFELYGEKLSLLIEKESEMRIQYLNSKKGNSIQKLENLQLKTLRTIEQLSVEIERQTKSEKILAKIYYYRALNYYMVKDYDKFHIFIKKSEQFNKDEKLGHLINTKLADYYYNNKNYKNAEVYYKKIIQVKDKWIVRYYYNLAWTMLKLEQTNEGLSFIILANSEEKNKDNYKLGGQLVDTTLLFYAFAGKTVEGLKYIKENKLFNFEIMSKYINHVYEHGKRLETTKLLKETEKTIGSIDDLYKLLDLKIKYYRNLKLYSPLQESLKRFSRNDLKKKGSSEVMEQVITSLKGYTGYLQELVKAKRYMNESEKEKYTRYIAYNFNFLKKIDIKNSIKYSYFEGETYFSLKKFTRASFVYAKGISEYKGSSKNSYLDKSFDSLFKTLEIQKKTSDRLLEFTYKNYVKFYPKRKKSSVIYQRLANLYQEKNDSDKFYKTLALYNKNIPKDIKLQRNYFNAELNKLIGKKDIIKLNSMKKLASEKFLGFKPRKATDIEKAIQQIRFEKFDTLADNGKLDEAIKGFDELYMNKENNMSLRVDAIRKIKFYLKRAGNVGQTYLYLDKSISFYNEKYLKKFSEELLYYTNYICTSELFSECVIIAQKIIKNKSLNLTSGLDELYFKKLVVSGTNDIEKFKLAGTEARKNYLFKYFLLKDPTFSLEIYKKFYTIKSFEEIINSEIDKRIYNKFFETLSINKTKDEIKNIQFEDLNKKYSKIFNELDSIQKKSKFVISIIPKDPNMTAESFAEFGQKFFQVITSTVKNIEQSITEVHPNLLPYFLDRIITNFEIEYKKVSQFIPLSTDAELEKAMSSEMLNYNKFFDKKIIEYKTLYYKAIDKSDVLSGSRKYSNERMIKPLVHQLGNLSIWSN